MGLCASNDAKPAEDEASPKPFSDLAQQQASGGGDGGGANNKQSARYGAGNAAASSSSSASGPAATQLGTAATDIVFSVCAGGWDEATGLPDFFCGSEDKSFAQFNATRVAQRVPDAHTRCISDLSYSLPDRKLYSASRDKTIRSWSSSAAEGGQWKLSSTLSGHTLPITCLEICASNPARLVSGGRDYQLRLWDTETNACLRWTEIQQNIITDVAWLHGQDDLVLQASEDLTLRLWDMRTKTEAQSFSDGPYFALHASVSPDNNYFLTGHNGFEGVGCELKCFDRRSGRKCLEVQVASQAITDAAFVEVGGASHGLYAASASKDGSLKLWDVSAILSAGDAVALSDQPCAVGLIAEANFDVGQESVQSLASASAIPANLAARKGRAYLATGHVNGRVSVWDVDVQAKQMQLRAQSLGSQQ